MLHTVIWALLMAAAVALNIWVWAGPNMRPVTRPVLRWLHHPHLPRHGAR